MIFVLHSSVALAWCFADKQTPGLLSLLEHLRLTVAAAPQIWPLELLDGFRAAENGGKLTQAPHRLLRSLLRRLPVEFDGQPVEQSLDAITRLADRFELNSRQATYLELAQRRDLPLATLDPRLAIAAKGLRISLLDT